MALRPPFALKDSRPALAVGLVGVAAVVHAALGSPGLVDLPGWFYAPTHRGLGLAWSTGIGALAAAAALSWAGIEQERPRRCAFALFLGALALQLAFIGTAPEGLGAVWVRLSGGHGEFLAIAGARDDAWAVLRRYDFLVASHELGHFPPSKPPGAMAFYFLVDRLGGWLAELPGQAALVERAARSPASGHAEGAALAAWLFPLLTALVAPLGHGLVRGLGGTWRQAFVAGLLLASSPALLLITHHLDGALYPVFGTAAGVLLLSAVGGGRAAGRATAAFAGGATLALGVYTTFSLLPLGLGVAAFALGRWGQLRRRGDGRTETLLVASGSALVGFTSCALLLVLGLRFAPATRFAGAMAHHAEWKAAVPQTLWRVAAPLEFFLWVGWPLVFCAFWAVLRSRPERWVARVTLATIALTSAASGTNEVARLWLFFVPLVTASVALSRPWRRSTLAVLVTAQLATALALRAAGPW